MRAAPSLARRAAWSAAAAAPPAAARICPRAAGASRALSAAAVEQPPVHAHAGSAAAPAAAARTTVDEAEVRKFSALAASWWRDDGRGPFAPLHSLNALRVPLIRQALLDDRNTGVVGDDGSSTNGANARAAAGPRAGLPLAGYRVLDVGCGGGILSESLARVGAAVTGIDASEANVAAAALHASHDPDLAARLTFRAVTVEAVAAEVARGGDCSSGCGSTDGDGRYDAVVASEVLEHVADRGAFLDACAALVKVSARGVVGSPSERAGESGDVKSVRREPSLSLSPALSLPLTAPPRAAGRRVCGDDAEPHAAVAGGGHHRRRVRAAAGASGHARVGQVHPAGGPGGRPAVPRAGGRRADGHAVQPAVGAVVVGARRPQRQLRDGRRQAAGRGQGGRCLRLPLQASVRALIRPNKLALCAHSHSSLRAHAHTQLCRVFVSGVSVHGC
jgi:ubiquinone biosynthesis O-methyltransferase